MKKHLDELMEKRGLDAFIIGGGEQTNTPRYYLTNGAHITRGWVFKKRDEALMVVVNGMELDEAKKSGLENIQVLADLGYYDLLQEEDMTVLKAATQIWGKCLSMIGIESGKVGIYGTWDINETIELFKSLSEAYPQIEFVGESGTTLFDEAMLTKDYDEIERLKSVAQRTNDVMESAWNYLSSQQIDGNTLVDSDGNPITIGDVKAFVRRELLSVGLEDTGMIFAQGRDAGFPHSRGEADDVLKLGQSIVFDLFPQELGGGYFHDMTRTWCLGYAPPEVQQTYDDVMEAFDRAIETFGVNKPTHLMQEAVLETFEGKGYATSRQDSTTQEGYVHSLGHGVGLNIHERPSISHLRKEDTFQVGNVVTIEPGLYYPEKGYGVRIEDLCIVTKNGELISLTPFRKDLVIPINGVTT